MLQFFDTQLFYFNYCVVGFHFEIFIFMYLHYNGTGLMKLFFKIQTPIVT